MSKSFGATVFLSSSYSGKRPSENMDIMVLETDYSSYAMLVLKRAGKMTMKLYGRCMSILTSHTLSFIVMIASVCKLVFALGLSSL